MGCASSSPNAAVSDAGGVDDQSPEKPLIPATAGSEGEEKAPAAAEGAARAGSPSLSEGHQSLKPSVLGAESDGRAGAETPLKSAEQDIEADSAVAVEVESRSSYRTHDIEPHTARHTQTSLAESVQEDFLESPKKSLEPSPKKSSVAAAGEMMQEAVQSENHESDAAAMLQSHPHVVPPKDPGTDGDLAENAAEQRAAIVNEPEARVDGDGQPFGEDSSQVQAQPSQQAPRGKQSNQTAGNPLATAAEAPPPQPGRSSVDHGRTRRASSRSSSVASGVIRWSAKGSIDAVIEPQEMLATTASTLPSSGNGFLSISPSPFSLRAPTAATMLPSMQTPGSDRCSDGLCSPTSTIASIQCLPVESEEESGALALEAAIDQLARLADSVDYLTSMRRDLAAMALD
mmetsp:Transcript_58124/g.138300  ORF Transcript_58124/g.138300 Transcript_58124/m.138300 type:complete len:402 (-) Transcript_58124:155-1360(-)